MRRLPCTLVYLCLCAVCLLPAAVVQAALRIEAPAEAAQGSAVLLRLTADAPGEATLHWQGAQLTVPLRAEGGVYSGRALVPMPLEERKPLAVRAECGGQSAWAEISPTRVDWPTQELKVEGKYVAPPPAVQRRIKDEQERNKAVLGRIGAEQYWSAPFARPVPGEVSSVFGGKRVFNGEPRSRHRGVDLRGAEGTPILALADGRVAIAADQYFSGNVVFVDHGQGFVSMYAHMSERRVDEGQMVKAGQELGLVGATGRVTGPHLHLGTFLLGKPVDPMSLVAMPGAPDPAKR